MVQKQKPVPMMVRLPKKMVSALDKAAERNCRSRNQEVKARLARSLSDAPAAGVERDDHARMVAEPGPSASEKSGRGHA